MSQKYCRSLPPLVFLTAAGALTLLFALNCTLAHAQGPPPGGVPGGKPATPDPLMAAASRWDADHDGVFTCEEWKQYASRLFTLADKNTDGFLDAKEFQQLGKVEPIFADAESPTSTTITISGLAARNSLTSQVHFRALRRQSRLSRDGRRIEGC